MSHPKEVDPIGKDAQSDLQHERQQGNETKNTHFGHVQSMTEQVKGVECGEEPLNGPWVK